MIEQGMRFAFSGLGILISCRGCGTGQILGIHDTAAVTHRTCTCFTNRVFCISMQMGKGHLCRGVAPGRAICRRGKSTATGGNKNCGNSHRNCRSRFSASKTTAIRTCRSRCGSHRLSSSPDLRIYGTVRPSQVSPMTGFRLAQPSTHTVAVPFVICTRFSILPWGCYRSHRHSNGYSLADSITLRTHFVNRKMGLQIDAGCDSIS